MKPYPFQQEIIEQARVLIRGGCKKLIIQAPTGAGKTVIASEIIRSAQEKGKLNNTIVKCVFLVHRQELVRQVYWTLYPLCDGNLGRIQTKHSEQYHHPLQVGMITTIKSPKRIDRWVDWGANLIIVDECHHARAETWQSTLDKLTENGAVLIGLSATPARLDGKGLGDVFDEIVFGPSVSELIESGHLSPYKIFSSPDGYDLTNVKISMGDYQKSDLETQALGSKRVRNVVELWNRYAAGKSTIFFGVSVKHSQLVAQRFNEAGISAAHIDGTTNSSMRDKLIRDFEKGDIQVLCNVGLISEGFDMPKVHVVIDDAPTLSLTLYMQRAGRVLRPEEGKVAILLDLAGNYRIHGTPKVDRTWSLADSPKKTKRTIEAVKVATQLCEKCYMVNEGDAIVCASCGAELKTPKEHKERDMTDLSIVDNASEFEEIEVMGHTIRWCVALGGNKQRAILKKAHALKKEKKLEKKWLLAAAKEAGYAYGWARMHWDRLHQKPHG